MLSTEETTEVRAARRALAQVIGAREAVEAEEMAHSPLYGEGVGFEVGNEEWAVLTDAEADAAVEESLTSYLDECVLPEVPSHVRPYFDGEAWRRDARMDGRGHILSSYDGEEHEAKVDGEWFYVYRVN